MDTEKDTDRYPFKVNRRYQGIALVISNFTSGPYMRKGADIDLKYMKKTFKRLGFKVDCHENLTTSKFVSLLNSYSKDKSLNVYDCFVFAISSHGIEREVKKKDQVVHHHAIQMFDDEYFDTQEVLDHFSPKACKALKNKPKLFFIQACRIPESKATEDHRDAGIGFDHGTRHRDGGGEPGQNKHGRDKIDHQETKEISDEESDTEEVDVSDTDIDEDSDLEGDNDLPTTKSQDTDTEGEQDTSDVEKYLEQRQREIVRNLKKLQNEVWQLGRVYTQEANHNKETDTQNATGGEGALSPEIEQKDDELDPARGIRLQPSAEKGMPGDEVDPPRARRYRPTVAPIHITAVSFHNDMLIMFASPQGLYAFRSKDIGSYMLRFLYKAVEKFYGNGKLKDNNTNFLEVLREITAQMSSRTFFGEKEYTNVPCTIHKLSKDVIFTQGKNMADSKFSKKLSSILTSFFANWK
ncbi:uncharacterized protein LOC133185241 [Saccostrea echinata]|uniref:uncharacterized protein LOC133185241 n=1 Tax=Saccostrea echinata TaxID=191078 RepID=UPI002A81D2F6|nr:uncharacterized protein LOC133185241 [Saccostrea echinata]